MLKKTCIAAALTLALTPQVHATNIDELQAYLLELISFSDNKDDEPAHQVNAQVSSNDAGDVTIQNRPLEGEPDWEAN